MRVFLVLALFFSACDSGGGSGKRGDVSASDTAATDTAQSKGDLVCSDGECTDSATGYVWAAPGAVPGPVSGVVQACEDLATANHSDYHLPTLAEAKTFPLGPTLLIAHEQFPDSIGVFYLDAEGTVSLLSQGGPGNVDGANVHPICVRY